MSAPAEESPLIAMMREKLAGHDGPFAMFVHFHVESGRAEEFVAAFRVGIDGTRAEPGNLRYELNRGLEDDHHFVLYERWPNLEALVTHTEQPHYAAAGDATRPMLTEPIDVEVLIATDAD